MRSAGSARVIGPEYALGRDHRQPAPAASPSLATGIDAARADGAGRLVRWGLLAVAVVWLGACGGGSREAAAGDTLTTRERQEAIGRSGLPGATGINRALEVADSATARQAELDSLIRSR